MDFQAAESSTSTRDDEGSAPWAARVHRQQLADSSSPTHWIASDTDPTAELAEQVMREVREHVGFADRLALRLHVDGYSYQEIADLTGIANRFRVRRLLDKVKEGLRDTFAQAWQALGDSMHCLL